MISAARLTDMSSTAVEFIRRSWSPGCSFPSAVLPAGNRHVVSHDSTATADLLPPRDTHCELLFPPGTPFASAAASRWQNKKGPKDVGCRCQLGYHCPCPCHLARAIVWPHKLLPHHGKITPVHVFSLVTAHHTVLREPPSWGAAEGLAGSRKTTGGLRASLALHLPASPQRPPVSCYGTVFPL